jgi:hypothetical protein
MIGKIAMVAIIRDELPFLDEWLVYHRRMGFDHFFLYLNEPDPSATMKFLSPHSAYVTPIEWYGRSDNLPGRNRQTKAYTHALTHHLKGYSWVAYLDVDEFMVFNQHPGVREFLAETGRPGTSAISLHWKKFGHSGFFDPPPRLITSSLLRRQRQTNRQCKTISKCSDISSIKSAHHCVMRRGRRVGADGNEWNNNPGAKVTDVACIHHYQCRSFTLWMRRSDFGPVAEDVRDQPDQNWSCTPEGCLRQFVKTVAVDFNECQDNTMLMHKIWLEAEIAKIQELRK